jgi:hypothetical protein
MGAPQKTPDKGTKMQKTKMKKQTQFPPPTANSQKPKAVFQKQTQFIPPPAIYN